MKNTVVTLLAFLALSCTGGKTDNIDLLFQGMEASLSSRVLPIPAEDIGTPLYADCVDDRLVVSNFNSERLLRVYDLESGRTVSEAVYAGRGENELLNVSSQFVLDGQLYVYSTNSRKVARIDLSDPADPVVDTRPFDGFYLRMSALDGNRMIVTPGMDGSMFSLTDPSGIHLTSFGDYPADGISDLPGIRQLAYQGMTGVNPGGSRAVYGSSNGRIIKFIRTENDRPVIFKEYVFGMPAYIPESDQSTNSYSVMWRDESPQGVRAVAVSDKYCFLLMDGDKTMADEWRSDKIYVFDWDGNPVRKLSLDRPLETVTYHAARNSLIGLTTNEVMEHEFVVFELDGI